MEIFTYYVLPNVALFGSIFLFSKFVEHVSWHVIYNYDNIVKGIQNYGKF